MLNLSTTKNIIDVTDHINKFRLFMILAWPDLDNLMEYHDWDIDGDFMDDWLQVNWELLIEREILGRRGYLTSFGTFYDSERITSIKMKSTHTIHAISKECILDLKNNTPIPFEHGLRLYGFLMKGERGFGYYPPFDVANLIKDSTKELFLAPVNLLSFKLVKLEK